MRIAIIATYTHPTRLPRRERSVMQSAVPELIAGLCPREAEIEIYNEKEGPIPLDRHWDLVFFSYLHSYYEHTKVLSTLFRRSGMTTVAGGRHASHFPDDCARYFDAVIVGDPEGSVPALVDDFVHKRLEPRYERRAADLNEIRPYRWDLINYANNTFHLPGVEASRGCPFACNFCVLTGHETYRYRSIPTIIDEIEQKMSWNRNVFGLFSDAFLFLDNNLGGSPRFLKELCEALIPLKKHWGCALTFNILRNEELVRLMSRAGCRYIYTGLESLNPDSIESMNKRQNSTNEVAAAIRRTAAAGILVSYGLLVGSDGDTNEYLERLPSYLDDLKCTAITFLGIVCPYPETPFYQTVSAEGRLLPGTISRDYDGFTLCHRPKKLSSSEVVEHFLRLSNSIGGVRTLLKHYWNYLPASREDGYRSVVLGSGLELLSIRNITQNPARKYIAGHDAIEAWDAEQMKVLGLAPQELSLEPAPPRTAQRRGMLRTAR